jgi:O-antigen ligase
VKTLLLRIRPADAAQWVFLVFLGLLLAGGAVATLLKEPALVAPALALMGLVLLLNNWRWVYYLLFLTLPFSREISLPGGMSMDVASEPLMLTLTACVPVVLLLGRGGFSQLRSREWLHPLLILPALLLLWACLDTFFSVNVLKSVKYVLAKIWYLTPFLLGTLLLVRKPADFWRLLACYVVATAASLLWVIPRHAALHFTFASINEALRPFYRNHVTYATALALLLPFVWGLADKAPTRRLRWVWWSIGGLLFFGLITSYTRASWLALPAAGIYFVVMRWRLTWLMLARPRTS